MKIEYCFPFLAVKGQERIKRALILNVINPKIGGVLISGEKGTAKSTLVRGLSNVLSDIRVVNLPLNVTEDRLVGSIDIKKAIDEGKKGLDSGILKDAHNQILYIDEVNLLSEYIVNILLEVTSTKTNNVQREGISVSHPSDFILIGSMNPEEGILRSQFIDRFGLYVEAISEDDIDTRTEIIKRRLEYEKNPKLYCEKWQKENENLKTMIYKSKENLKSIKISKENLEFAAGISKEGRCSGHRAEIILIEASRAIAALNCNSVIEEDYIKEAATYVLPHRLREEICIDEIASDQNCDDNSNNSDAQETSISNDYNQDTKNHNDEILENINNFDDRSVENKNESSIGEKIEDNIEDIQEINDKLTINVAFDAKKDVKGSGKRNKVKTDIKQGRYIKYKIPHGKINDIAIDATLRIAACNQKKRKNNGLAVNIKTEDLREKVREKRTGATILFLVDASGSMGAKKRMGAVKGAVLSLLNDAYQKRDSVGVIAFRKDSADVLLNITRSVDLAQKCLKDISIGGKTPLALGLYKAYEILRTNKIKNKDALQYLVIVSDGKANVGLKTNNCLDDALSIAENIKADGIKSMVIDTESGYIQYGFAKELSKKLDSSYVKISNINKSEIESNIKDLIK